MGQKKKVKYKYEYDNISDKYLLEDDKMSIFHKTIRDALKINHLDTAGAHKKLNIVSDHMKAIDAEFKIEQITHRKLIQYYELLREIRGILAQADNLTQGGRGRHSPKEFYGDNGIYRKRQREQKQLMDLADVKLKELQKIVADVEREIRVEYSEAHKFLE